jgi:2-polyprenyl-3-methyl-5-hydroxy-6-metoxy-1,4-benzoquinol methylase
MDDATRRTLQAINRRFYAERAADFDSSRSRPWQGWPRALAGLGDGARKFGNQTAENATARGFRISEHRPLSPLSVLDLGCGNGRLLAHLLSDGFEVELFVGVDSCAELIELARGRYPQPFARFEHAELFDESGAPTLPSGVFDVVALMGVLHHVPSEEARRALVHAAFERTAPQGVLVLTVWRFERDSRLSKRTVAWPDAIAREPELAQLDLAQLERGDTLLQWNKGQRALRYCHAIAPDEIERWLSALPARVVERFYADGEGELNEYLVLRR